MKTWIRMIFLYGILLLLASVSYAKEALPLAEDPMVEERLIRIAKDMRCLVCQNESLIGSQADLAVDLREELRNLIRQEKTDDEIQNYMVERYGEFVLYRPLLKPTTWLLWLGPFVMLLVGIGIMLKIVRRLGKTRSSVVASSVPTTEDGKNIAHLSEQEQVRLKKLLQESAHD